MSASDDRGSTAAAGMATFINVIEIDADQVDRFVSGWRERGELMRTLPGFRDYQLHRATLPDSRFQLINVAHWDSREAYYSAMGNPEFLSRMQALQEDATLEVTAYPGLYDVVLQGNRERPQR